MLLRSRIVRWKLLRPTNDPIQVMRRANDDAEKAARRAQEAGGTEAFQAVRKIQQQIKDVIEVQEQMIELFNAMPQNDGRQVDKSGWSVNQPPATGSWSTVAAASIPRPSKMNRVAVSVVATASGVLNQGSSGALQGRVLINGVASEEREGAMELLASRERCTLQMAFFREVTGLKSGVSVEFQVRGRYSEFAPSNNAALTISAGFTRVG